MYARRNRFVVGQLVWMLATLFFLVLIHSFSYELFFLVSLIGLLVLTELTKPFHVTPAWQGRLRQFILVGLAGFAYIVVRRILEILPPGVFQRVGWLDNLQLSIPQALLIGLVVGLLTLVVAGSTSSQAFGTFNGAWDGSSSVRTAVEDTGATVEVITETTAYEDTGSETVAIVLATTTRTSEDVAHGASTRATLMLIQGSKGRAAIHNRDYVIPDDILALAEPALEHRLVLDTEADLSGRTSQEILADIMVDVDVPEVDLENGV